MRLLKQKGVEIIACDREPFRKLTLPQTDSLHQGSSRGDSRSSTSSATPRRDRHVIQSTGVSQAPDSFWPRCRRGWLARLLFLVDAIAASLLMADLLVVLLSVFYRYGLAAPIEWADDVARGLMVAMAFFGAAGALARNENASVAFFVEKLNPRARGRVDAIAALVVLTYRRVHSLVRNCVGAIYNWANDRLRPTAGIDVLPDGRRRALHDDLRAYPVLPPKAVRHRLRRRPCADVGRRGVRLAFHRSGRNACRRCPCSWLLSRCLTGGVPIGFALAFTALIYIWIDGALPGLIFAQQMARGIDNFVLLAIPFFILVGYLMEANGMSVRLIALLERLVGRARGGLNVVMVLAMVIFSGISGSKMADVAAVGSVLIPAARRSRQNPGSAVALLAASAVMAETIPPCINLIILGFVANLSIGGLFMAGLFPAALMALALIGAVILLGGNARTPDEARLSTAPLSQLWSGAM